jgi:hypothetical protein
MPSDKIAVMSTAFITPGANSTTKVSGGADLRPTHHPNKDGINLTRAIKTKRQSKINLQLPSLSAIFNI